MYVQPEDGLYQAPKHVVVTYVENTSYSTNKYNCVRRVHTLYISYCIEHSRDDEPHDYEIKKTGENKLCKRRSALDSMQGSY